MLTLLKQSLWLNLLVYSAALTLAQILMKRGLGGADRGLVSLVNVQLCVGVCIQIGCVVLWLVLLRTNKLTVMFPMATGMCYALMIIASAAVFGERLSPQGLLGIATILLGLFMLAD